MTVIINRYYIIDSKGTRIEGPYRSYDEVKHDCDLLCKQEPGVTYGIELEEDPIKIQDYVGRGG